VKINQYCSVCKKHLDMEVIPTDDGGDDGVIWLRCPDCQGFLPKFTGDGLAAQGEPATATAEPTDQAVADHDRAVADRERATETPEPAPDARPSDDASTADQETGDRKDAGEDGDAEEDEAPSEPIAEYAAQLAAADPEQARPYRPSATYDVGDLIHHLAYGDFGIVVAKEQLPGGRRAVKVFFEGAGVVHLIEQAADGH
jgi:hypothetical protein